MRAIGWILATAIVLAVAAFIGGVLVAPGVVGDVLGRAAGTQVEEERPVEAAPAITGAAYPGDPETEATLVDREAARLVDVRAAASAGPSEAFDTTQPFRIETAEWSTFVLPTRAAPYTLDEIAGLAPETLSLDGPDGAFVLHEHLVVMEGGALEIAAGQRLLIASDASHFGSVVAYGDLLVEGTAEQRVAIESWDPGTGARDDTTADGRAYVRVLGGVLTMASADVRSLGFWSGETGGLAYDGRRAAARELEPAPAPDGDGAPTAGLVEAPPVETGLSVSDTTVEGNVFGLVVAGVEGASITGSTFTANLADGLVLDDDVTGATVQDVESSRNGRDGVVAGRSTSSIGFERLTAADNGRDGLLLDGRPVADGPNSTGASAVPTGDMTVNDSELTQNARSGIDVLGGTGVRISGVRVTGGDMGIVLDSGAADVEVSGSTVTGQSRHGISVRDDATGVTIDGNTVSDLEIGIYVRNARADVSGNEVSDATLHGIVLSGQLGGSRITDNVLSGTGPSAIDDDRALHARVEGNLVDGWAASRSLEQVLTTLMQPLTVVWILVVTLVIVALITRLGAGRRRNDPLADRAPLQSLSRGVFDRAEAGRFTS